MSAPSIHLTKKRIFIIVLFAVVLLASFIAVPYAITRGNDTSCAFRLPETDQTRRVFSPNRSRSSCVQLEKLTTEAQRIQGLSGRNALPMNQGLLFVFDDLGDHCMWMKDMQFSIDMIWLNEDREILKIEKDVSPSSFPETFCSNEPARYVIEVNAGIADYAGLKKGQRIYL